MGEYKCCIYKYGFSVSADCSTIPPDDDQEQTFTLSIQRSRIPDIIVTETEVTLVLDRDILDALNDADDLVNLH